MECHTPAESSVERQEGEAAAATAGATQGDASKKTRNLGAMLRRRLQQAAEQSSDLLRRFTDERGEVPIAAFFFDKRVRREVLAPGVPTNAVLDELVDAARATDGIDIRSVALGGFCLKLSSADLPPAKTSHAGSAEVLGAPAVGSSCPAPAPTVEAAVRGRDVKNELQTKVCKILGRSVTKSDIVFTAERVSDQPPQFVATLKVLNRSFTGVAMPQKKMAEQAAACVALDFFSSERCGGVSASHDDASSNAEEQASSTQAGSNDGPPQADADSQIDYKGQLLTWLQARGIQGAGGVLSYEVDRCSEDEKIFGAKVILHALGNREFTGSPQCRDSHGSSAKARRAAEHTAAQAALLALEAEEGQPCRAAAAAERSVKRVCILRLASSTAELPKVEELEVVSDDFLSAAARALQCSCAIPHPLQWSGDRPKGLCLYESVDSSEAPTPSQHNRSASLLADSPVAGDAILLDGSAHTHGAVLADMTGARYEAVKAERNGVLNSPVAALNASRNMLIGGHVELPRLYDAETWMGMDPRTLLNTLLTRQRLPLLKFVLATEGGAADGAASVYRVSTEVVLKDGARLQVSGAPREKKADANQACALAAMHAIIEHAACAGDGVTAEHVLAGTALSAIGQRVKSEEQHTTAGTPVVRYSISVAVPLADETRGTSTGMPLVLEECKSLHAVRGAHVLHPVLEHLATNAPVGKPQSYSTECEYDGVPCQFHLEMEVTERLAVADAPGSETCEGARLLFEPPLRQQRCTFIVELLRHHRVEWAVDLGCGDGQLLEGLLHAGVPRVMGVDSSEARVRAARRRVDALACREQHTVEVLLADILKPDWRWTRADAVVLSEVLEHLPDAQFSQLGDALLGIEAKLVVVTTPNGEFGTASSNEGDGKKGVRHTDHERELSRKQFREWAEAAALKHGYELADAKGVGELDGHEAEGPCSQIAVFTRIEEASSQGDTGFAKPRDEVHRPEDIFDENAEIDISSIAESALHDVELVPGSGLRKFVVRKGSGEVPLQSSRITVHHATHLGDGRRLSASRRQGQRFEPFVFQLGGGHALEAWQQAVATMCKGELAWIRSPPSFAYGELGAPPLIPAGEVLWFALELVDFRPPATLQSFKELEPALEEGERQLERGRSDVKRQAFVQARQAFRRAIDAVPPKLLLGHDEKDVARYAALERSALLNQALCSQRLAESEAVAEVTKHWEDVNRVCTRLLDRHFQEESCEVTEEMPGDLSMVVPALRAASSAASSLSGGAPWAAKAHFRRALARHQLNYISDALADLMTAKRLMPEDAEISTRLEIVRQQQQRVELKPSKMFTGILERERNEREQEEARAALEEKKRRREARLQREASRAASAAS